MAASQTLGVLSGNAPAEAAPGYDPNRPVEKPRHCGMCKHFRRIVPTADQHPRARRFGDCTRWAFITADGKSSSPETDPADRGPMGLVGDEFACKFFDSGF